MFSGFPFVGCARSTTVVVVALVWRRTIALGMIGLRRVVVWLAISTVVGPVSVSGGLPHRRGGRVLRLLVVPVTWPIILRVGIVSRLARDL